MPGDFKERRHGIERLDQTVLCQAALWARTPVTMTNHHAEGAQNPTAGHDGARRAAATPRKYQVAGAADLPDRNSGARGGCCGVHAALPGLRTRHLRGPRRACTQW